MVAFTLYQSKSASQRLLLKFGKHTCNSCLVAARVTMTTHVHRGHTVWSRDLFLHRSKSHSGYEVIPDSLLPFFTITAPLSPADL